jgi:monovalent cation:H+ antiporter, CPA1 family
MTIEKLGLLLLIASLVAMLARRFHFPYTVGLLLSGIALAVFPDFPNLELTRKIIFLGLLPPLIFEAALFINWSVLQKQLVPVLTFASFGLVLAAAITAAGMHLFLGWPLLSASLFGILIAATDPVSVIATFKEAGVQGKLRIIVEAESLFNDGVAAVLFSVLLVFAEGHPPTLGIIMMSTFKVIGGAILCGLLVAQTAIYLMGKTDDHLLELTFTTITAYAAFMLAEQLHCSGVLAVLSAGLLIGNRAPFSEKGREAVEAFWEFGAFVANSLVFLLIGFHVAKQPFQPHLASAAIAILMVLLGRVSAIYPLSLLFSRSAQALSKAHQHALVWGGLRGALALALALSLPLSIPLRSEIITMTFAVVAFSVVVQGLTFTPVLKKLGLLN